MSSRLWVLATGIVLVVVAGALWWMSSDASVCLVRVAPAPDGAYANARPTGDGSLEITYGNGSKVTVPTRPQRVVSLLPGITEMWADLDGVEHLVGVTEHCDFPDAVHAIREVGVYPLDVESILELQPDLVLVDRTYFRTTLASMADRLPAVLPLESSRSLPHLLTSFDMLARVAATPRARRKSVRFRQDAENLVKEIGSRAPAPPPRVLLVAQWDPLNVLGPGALLDDLLRICGCVNVACDLPHPSGPFDEELVLTRMPDWILSDASAVPDAIAARWKSVPAIAGNRTASFRANDLVRGGPRVLDALRRLDLVLRGEAAPDTLPGSP